MDLESVNNLSFIPSLREHAFRKNMLSLLPGTYSVGNMSSVKLSRNECEAINSAFTTNCTTSTVVTAFSRLYHNNTLMYSMLYMEHTVDGKRNSTTCSFICDNKERFGVIQKFVLCQSLPPIAIIKPYVPTASSLLGSLGNSGRRVLQTYAEVDILSSFFIQVKKELSDDILAVPIAKLASKCVKVSSHESYIVKIPNPYEHH